MARNPCFRDWVACLQEGVRPAIVLAVIALVAAIPMFVSGTFRRVAEERGTPAVLGGLAGVGVAAVLTFTSLGGLWRPVDGPAAGLSVVLSLFSPMMTLALFSGAVSQPSPVRFLWVGLGSLMLVSGVVMTKGVLELCTDTGRTPRWCEGDHWAYANDVLPSYLVAYIVLALIATGVVRWWGLGKERAGDAEAETSAVAGG